MASLLVRCLDDSIKIKLRIRAAEHGRSMEAEVREILRITLSTPPEKELNLAESIRSIFDPLGPFELELPPRQFVGEPPAFNE